MKLVVLESPYGSKPDGTRCSPAEVAANVVYLRRCLADSLRRGEAPFASHGLYPGTLDDAVPEDRRLGMEAGFAWGAKAERVVVYTDNGITTGMAEGIRRAVERGVPVDFRNLASGSTYEVYP